MKLTIKIGTPLFSILLVMALMLGSCGSSDNKNPENATPEIVANDSATGMEDNPELSAETAASELPGEMASNTPNTTTSAVPKNAAATQAGKEEAVATTQPCQNITLCSD